MPISANEPMLGTPAVPTLPDDLPIGYEDDHEVEMGESNLHFVCDDILYNGIKAHFAGRPLYYVYSNMNLHYHPRHAESYRTPDVMVVHPLEPLPDDLASYRIGEHGPAPLQVTEILSRRTAARGDKTEKVEIYAKLRISEYILADLSGTYLPERLLLKRLRLDGTWEDLQDPDGGITSSLGFRVIFDDHGRLRVLDAQTGKPYARPDEAELEAEKHRLAEAARAREADTLRRAEERIRELEAELARLRQEPPGGNVTGT